MILGKVLNVELDGGRCRAPILHSLQGEKKCGSHGERAILWPLQSPNKGSVARAVVTRTAWKSTSVGSKIAEVRGAGRVLGRLTFAAGCTSNPDGCGLTFRGHTSRCTRYWDCKLETRVDRRTGDVDGHSKEDGGRDFASKDPAAVRRYSTRQQDNMYLVAFASSCLKFLDR